MDTNRLQQIREAVAHDAANLEDVYTDRAWLLFEVDRLTLLTNATRNAQERPHPWCDDLGIERPHKYCRMGECERKENGGTPCKLWSVYQGVVS